MHVQCACSYRTHRFISGSNAPPMYRTFYGILYFFWCRTPLSHNELVVCGDRRQHSRLMNDDSSSLMNTEWDRSDKQNERHSIIIFCSLNRWFRVDCCSFNPTYLYTSFSNKEEQLGMPSFSFRSFIRNHNPKLNMSGLFSPYKALDVDVYYDSSEYHEYYVYTLYVCKISSY